MTKMTNTDRSTSAEVITDPTAIIDQLERAGQLGTWRTNFAAGKLELSPWLSRTLNVPASVAIETWTELLVPEDVEAAELFLQQAAIEQMPFTVVSRMRRQGSDEVIWFRHSGDPVVDRQGNVVDFTGVAKRIDYEIAAIEERTAFHETLQRVQRDESSSYLAGGLAHELLNLLQPVLFLSELASIATDQGDTAKVHDYLAKIETSAKRAGLVLRSTLDFARLNSDDPVPVSVAAVKDDLDSFLDPQLLRRVNLDIADDVADEQILATRPGIVQLTLNLLKNANEASDPDDPIDFRLRRSQLGDTGTPAIHLTIQDHGTGFSDEGLTRAFDPRFTTRFGTSGNGLGLVVVRAMVERWGGTIQISNNPTGGARVDIKLPALLADTATTS